MVQTPTEHAMELAEEGLTDIRDGQPS